MYSSLVLVSSNTSIPLVFSIRGRLFLEDIIIIIIITLYRAPCGVLNKRGLHSKTFNHQLSKVAAPCSLCSG